MSQPETAASALVKTILDRIVREIDDKRTFDGERTGLRAAHIIVRNAADEMGVSYE